MVYKDLQIPYRLSIPLLFFNNIIWLLNLKVESTNALKTSNSLKLILYGS